MIRMQAYLPTRFFDLAQMFRMRITSPRPPPAPPFPVSLSKGACGLWRPLGPGKHGTPKLGLHRSKFKVNFEIVPWEGQGAEPAEAPQRICAIAGAREDALASALGRRDLRRQFCCFSAAQRAGLWSGGPGTD